ncbi:VOC family protein [Xanthobacter versatilis]|jgi:catechol 2,3-dioxygenase|uniref:VOC family protein n=1 Tax=Xanthobacter autotrophicus (strain ATCC BAA-1158 / Py2) TaxID=78245 RepID=UPI00372B59E2
MTINPVTTHQMAEPIFDIAELSSFELFSPCVDETVWFFRDLLGMIETGRSGDSVFLRGWQEAYLHSLKITYRERPGMGFAGWRAMSPAALERRVKSIKDSGRARGWVEGEQGIGPSFEFTLPDGAVQRIHWDVEYYQPERDDRSVVLNRVQRRPLRGVPISGLDHLNILSRNVSDNRRFFAEHLGFKLSEHILLSDHTEAGAWLRAMTRSHDIALVKDGAGQGGRLHHVAFLYGNSQHLADICDVMTDHGLELEAGPALHGVSQAQFVYVFEPGGNRIELVGTPGYIITDPSWAPVNWVQDHLDSAIIWYGAPLPTEFDTYGTPHDGPTRYRTPNRYIAAEAALLLAGTDGLAGLNEHAVSR